MRYVAVLFGIIAMLAFVGCGDDDPVSSTPEEGIHAPAGKLVVSATKAGGLRSKAELRRIYHTGTEAWNVHDINRASSHWADDIVVNYVPFGLVTEGKEAEMVFEASFFESFPDIQWNTQRVLISGNILVAEWIATGTHEGVFLDIPPTGVFAQVPHLTINEYEEGKLKRATTYLDYVTLFVQLGAMPAGELPALVPSFELPDPEPTGLSPLEAAREIIEVWNTHDMTSWATMFHPDGDFFYNVLGIPLNRDQLVALQELFFLAFSDVEGEFVRIVDLGDGWVVADMVFQGTHDGPYFGIPATGRFFPLRVVVMSNPDTQPDENPGYFLSSDSRTD